MPPARRAAPLLAILVLVLVVACRPARSVSLSATVLERHPHDPRAFTQGLLWHDGALFESTGLYGASTLRRIDLESGEVSERRYLAEDLFAEGLARVEDTLVQLTWREGVALVWPLQGFAAAEGPTRRHAYRGEGWGLCFDGERLVMSDGSDRLTFRDPDDFRVLDSVGVVLDGEPLDALNELECVDGRVWANVWHEDRIVRIDPATGRVTATADLSGLLTDDEKARLQEGAVLNGIAWREETGTFLVTGKLWPALFEIRLEE